MLQQAAGSRRSLGLVDEEPILIGRPVSSSWSLGLHNVVAILVGNLRQAALRLGGVRLDLQQLYAPRQREERAAAAEDGEGHPLEKRRSEEALLPSRGSSVRRNLRITIFCITCNKFG